MSNLNRSLAPISRVAWEHIDAEAREVVSLQLAARRLVDFDGPYGWTYSACDLGDIENLEGPADGGGTIRKRLVRPLIELRVPFDLARSQLDRIDRGASSVDLGSLRDAARDFCAAEDASVFEGYAAAGIPGLLADATDPGIAFPDSMETLPRIVSTAISRLKAASVAGPFALVLDAREFEAANAVQSDDGYPLAKRLRQLLDGGPIVWGQALRGGVVASLRGGDFRFVCGRDMAIGYLCHDEESVRLYFEESFTFVLDGPEAVIPLLPASES